MDSSKDLIISMSHKRSKDYGVDRERKFSKKMLSSEELEKRIKDSRELINISVPYIEMINSSIDNKDFIIVLTDEKGCILYITGDETIVQEFKKLNLIIGAYMDEKSIGTNAMGTAIEEDKAVQITAEEHYIEAFQTLTCSAAPIHNASGSIIGTLNLTGASSKKHPHTLGMVMIGVKAIENEIHKNKTSKVLKESYNYMESLIDNMSKGIIMVDANGIIRNINNLGADIFNKEKLEVIGKSIENIVPDFKNILMILEGEREYKREIKLKHFCQYKTVLTFKVIKFRDKVIGTLILMQEEKEIERVKNTGAFYNFDDIIGESAAIKNVITNCKIISNSPSTVLIQGESGTGKEILAQAIHNYSHRRNNNFVAINCGAIPENIIESELFGYEDGTFTGGKKGGKKGKFELAHEGTLFLDEIGEMPIDMQVKLLRVLQEGRITRLGGDKEIPVDVRVIAATNRDLKEEIKKGKFREDLYYRLCVIPVVLPPLRERRGDVTRLIQFFLRVKALKIDKSVPTLDEGLYESLIHYNWPGNIRELENCIENIVNLGGKISFDLFSKDQTATDVDDAGDDELQISTCNLEEIEKRVIEKAIKLYDKNMTKVAGALGISRNTLYLKVKKYGIKS